MRKVSFIIAFFTWLYLVHSSFFQLSAQEFQPYKPSKFSDRVFFGGNFGLQFGDMTLVDVSPMAGYRFTDKIAAGLSISYKYYDYKVYNPNSTSYSNMKSNIYGAGIFGRYYFVENLFAHAEYEYLFYTYEGFRPNSVGGGYTKTKETVDFPGLFLGGGYRQPIGGRTSFTVTILYNVMESQYSPYSNPIIRAGFNVGL
jgi:hypothetical protein